MTEPKSLACPKCGAPLETAEVMEGAVVHACPSCFGTFYSKGEIAVRVDLDAPEPADWKCPMCGSAMETGTACEGRIELDRCTSCAGLWFDAGELETLRHLTGVEQIVRAPGAGDDELPPAKVVVPLPPLPAKPGAKAPAGAKPPAEPAGSDAKKAPKRTSDDDPTPPSPVEMSKHWGLVRGSPPWVNLGGKTFHHYQTSLPVTTHVLGEFPWVASVGDTVEMRDYISPPRLLSRESTEDETTWTLGEYVEPEEVWAAFKLPGAPPAKSGVAAAQPSPLWEASRWMRGVALAAAAVCIGVYAALAHYSLEQTVFDQTLTFSAQDAEKSRVTDIFALAGRTSNVEVHLESGLNNHWAYYDLALIEADTDKAYDFGAELEYYQGVEDGESWSEGAQNDTLYVPSVPPGRYYLRAEPESDTSPLTLRVKLTRDVPLLRVLLIALLLLALPLGLVHWRAEMFEKARWMESDHAWSSGGDDE